VEQAAADRAEAAAVDQQISSPSPAGNNFLFLSVRYDTIRYDTRCHFNVRSKANIIQLNLLHGTNTDSGKQTDDCFVMRHGDTGT